MRMQSSKDPQIVSLIQCVRRNACLYDYRQPEYHNEDYKESIWKLIANICQMQDADEAKNCWKNLQHSFTVFYRNELIRLVRANYNEADIGPLPSEVKDSVDERFENRTWGYYSDMRFIAPFRIKGTDPELERLIALAKPIVLKSDSAAKQTKTDEPSSKAPTKSAPVPTPSVSGAKQKSSTQMHVLPLKPSDLTAEELCLNSFFDSMFRATRMLPPHLQRRIKRELLQSVHRAEVEAEEESVRTIN